jgi:site-specific DNA-methyltransferase (adenine-specific)
MTIWRHRQNDFPEPPVPLAAGPAGRADWSKLMLMRPSFFQLPHPYVPAETTVPFERNTVQCGDALALLQWLPDDCPPLVIFDPQFREVQDHLAYGNEGARQRGRFRLPVMSSDYIDACGREIARVLRPSGYWAQWTDTYRLCEGYHLRLADVFRATRPTQSPFVCLIAWDNLHLGMGCRARHRGDYLLVLQKPPQRAKATWCDHSIPDRWPEKVDRRTHQHIKPIGLITWLIHAVTHPGDLVVDPAAGSYAVMHAAHWLGRDFIGCDVLEPPLRATNALDFLGGRSSSAWPNKKQRGLLAALGPAFVGRGASQIVQER